MMLFIYKVTLFAQEVKISLKREAVDLIDTICRLQGGKV